MCMVPIKTPPGWVKSPVWRGWSWFRAHPAVADAGTEGELFAISRDAIPGCQRSSPAPHRGLGMFWELLVALAAETPSASLPGHRSRRGNLIMRKGKRRETGKQGASVLPVLQQLAAVPCV